MCVCVFVRGGGDKKQPVIWNAFLFLDLIEPTDCLCNIRQVNRLDSTFTKYLQICLLLPTFLKIFLGFLKLVLLMILSSDNFGAFLLSWRAPTHCVLQTASVRNQRNWRSQICESAYHYSVFQSKTKIFPPTFIFINISKINYISENRQLLPNDTSSASEKLRPWIMLS